MRQSKCVNKAGSLRSRNHCCSVKAVLHILRLSIALGIQHATRMRHVFICGMPGCTVLFTFAHKRHDFRKKKIIGYKML